MRTHTTVSNEGRAMEVRRFRRTLAWLLAASAALGCSDASRPTGVPHTEPATPTPFVASVAPRPGTAQYLVYVSLPPGSLLGDGEAALRVARTGTVAMTHLVDGGFDPVALSAAEGDTIAVTVQGTGASSPVSYTFVVPKPSRPIVVRTSPPKQKRDVALNASVKVVFSEPVDQGSLTSSSMQLRVGGAAVAGRLEFADSAHTSAVFVPTAQLAAGTEYELVVTQEIRDLDGMPLESSLSVPFTTATVAAPSLFIVSRPFFGYVNPNDLAAPPDSAAFVSLPRGAIPNGTWAEIRRVRPGAVTEMRTVIDGGFNPVAVPARVGDVLTITVQASAGGSAQSFQVTVPSISSPTLVHTYPSPQQTNVPLDAAVEIVFSEPIADSALVESQGSPTALVQLLNGGVTTDAALWKGVSCCGTLWIWFVPRAPLTPGTDYVLVANGLTGRAGEAIAPLSLRFTTESPPPGPSDAVLTVTSFSMIEFEYPSWPGYWYYAPQIRVSETGGRSGARFIKMVFTIPGLANPIPPYCSTGTFVRAGESQDLLGELYGDYEYTAFNGDGARATAGNATAALIFRDDAGRTDTLTVSGPVVPGGLPTTYTGGNGHGYVPCQPGG